MAITINQNVLRQSPGWAQGGKSAYPRRPGIPVDTGKTDLVTSSRSLSRYDGLPEKPRPPAFECERSGKPARPSTLESSRRTPVKRGWILLTWTLALNACAMFSVREPLNVTIADLRPIEIGVLEQRYAMKVRLLNPNDADIAFDGAVFDLEINGTPFAKGVSAQSTVIPRFGEAVIEVQIVSGLQNILRQINELLKGDRTALTYRVKGRLYTAGGFGFTSFDTSGEIVLPKGSGKPG
jgi:LEA14-like dessication related protein